MPKPNYDLVRITKYDALIFYSLIVGGIALIITPTPDEQILTTVNTGFLLIVTALLFFGVVYVYSFIKKKRNSITESPLIKDLIGEILVGIIMFTVIAICAAVYFKWFN